MKVYTTLNLWSKDGWVSFFVSILFQLRFFFFFTVSLCDVSTLDEKATSKSRQRASQVRRVNNEHKSVAIKETRGRFSHDHFLLRYQSSSKMLISHIARASSVCVRLTSTSSWSRYFFLGSPNPWILDRYSDS